MVKVFGMYSESMNTSRLYIYLVLASDTVISVTKQIIKNEQHQQITRKRFPLYTPSDAEISISVIMSKYLCLC